MDVFRRQLHTFAPFAPVAVIAALLSCAPAQAQQSGSDSGDESTSSGTVASSRAHTLVVRGDNGRFQIYVYDRNTTKPANLHNGAQVRVSWVPSDEPGVRLARDITVTQAAGQGAARGTAPVVPPEVRKVESEIERQVRRFRVGVRGGVALDPELILIGVHSQVGPFFHSNVYLRPNVEFAYGEVTALFGLNLEAIYRLPLSSDTGRWSAYFGLGPGFNFIHQNFEQQDHGHNIDFGNFTSDTGLNILGGIQYRSGMFVELKTSVYSDPAPTLRMIVGYNF